MELDVTFYIQLVVILFIDIVNNAKLRVIIGLSGGFIQLNQHHLAFIKSVGKQAMLLLLLAVKQTQRHIQKKIGMGDE